MARPKHRMILTTCYAAGLRLGEALRFQVTDGLVNPLPLAVVASRQ